MDTVLIVAILAVILCSCSSIVAYFMIGKSNGETSSSEIEITDKIPDKKSSPSTPIRTYTKSVNMDIGGNDIACYQDGSSADFCKAKCDNDTTCKGYNYIHKDTAWGAASGCCYKTLNQPLTSINGVDFYALN
jgi:hypothetical protein